MGRAQKILAEIIYDIANIDSKLNNMGHYFILYTHTYEQKNEEAKNILCIPKEPKFDELEFYGLIVDMIRDYANNRNLKLQNNKFFKAFIDTLSKIERSENAK